jgi:hypothetical protein
MDKAKIDPNILQTEAGVPFGNNVAPSRNKKNGLA